MEHPSERTVLLHGGAGPARASREGEVVAGLRQALAAAAAVGPDGTPLDVAEAAVRAMEASGAFDAGRGSVLNARGQVEMDACVMEGTGRRTGAVAAVGRVLHAVGLARLVLERSRHVLLVGEGASRFADALGFPRCREEDLVCPRERERFEARAAASRAAVEDALGTVGAVVRDGLGRTAAATSTGGTIGKEPGRVGDSAIVGVSTFADDRTGALSTTGCGEAILRAGLGLVVAEALRRGASPREAVELGFARLAEDPHGRAGLVLATAAGALAAFNTESMAVAWSAPAGEGAALLENRTPGRLCLVELPAP